MSVHNSITAEPIFATFYSWIFLLKFGNTFQFWFKKRDGDFTRRLTYFSTHFEAKYLSERKIFRTEGVEKNEACFISKRGFP